MFTSSAEVFRTRQAVRDLVEAVGLHREAVLRLGITGADRDVISRITASGCRIDVDQQGDAYSSLLLASALPDEDFPSFIGATSILLADLLQSGQPNNDLHWNWDAFQDHYALADPYVRAALMNGFRLVQNLGLSKMPDPPTPGDCLTFGKGDVIATLQSVGLNNLCAAVRSDVSPEEAGRLWQETDSAAYSWQMLAGFRYLYERESSIAPPNPEKAPLIPWV